jgi:hypothetical protein
MGPLAPFSVALVSCSSSSANSANSGPETSGCQATVEQAQQTLTYATCGCKIERGLLVGVHMLADSTCAVAPTENISLDIWIMFKGVSPGQSFTPGTYDLADNNTDKMEVVANTFVGSPALTATYSSSTFFSYSPEKNDAVVPHPAGVSGTVIVNRFNQATDQDNNIYFDITLSNVVLPIVLDDPTVPQAKSVGISSAHLIHLP